MFYYFTHNINSHSEYLRAINDSEKKEFAPT